VELGGGLELPTTLAYMEALEVAPTIFEEEVEGMRRI
jgi:hypothetical protein